MNWNDLTNDGKKLEVFTASYFQAFGYYVDSNLKWLEDKADGTGKVDLFELDIYGKIFHKNAVTVVLAECKRGCDFNDLFKFAGIIQKVTPDRSILVCESHQEKDIRNAGKELRIHVVSPQMLADAVEKNSYERPFLFYYAANDLSNKLFEKERIQNILAPGGRLTRDENDAYHLIRKHLSVLIGEVWKTQNLKERSLQIKGLMDGYKDFVRTIARRLEIKPGNKSSEYYMRGNPLCQAAGYLMLKDRMAYIICAVECAVKNTMGVPVSLDRSADPNFYDVVEELSRNIETACLIPEFLQGLVYIFGGFLGLVGDDIDNISSYLKISRGNVAEMINLLKRLFEISGPRIQWGFAEDLGVLSLKYVPYPLKGLGIMNRETLGFSVDVFAFKEEWTDSIKVYK